MKKFIAMVLTVVMALSLVACGGEKVESHELKMGRVLGAAHGTKCFATAVAVVEGDKVVAAFIDEYQFMSGDQLISVPNAENYTASLAEGVKLVSKRVDTAVYSKNMADKAGSTVAIDKNYDAIQAHVAGKTIAELEAEIAGEMAADAVAGATLVDNAGYIAVIIEAAKAAQNATAVTYEGSLEALTLKSALGAAHGTKCFAETTVLTDGEKVVLAFIDEYQFMSGDQLISVPNAENYTASLAEGVKLVSKRVDTAVYSKNMADKAGSTVAIDANYDAIQAHVAGKTIAELETLVAGEAEAVVDAVAGATVVDAAGYIKAIIDVAKA